jgi:hypothetical protein
MATRQQVLSLFGATPAQIQERQRQQQQEFLAAQRTPEQLAGSAIGLGLARLFGGKSAEMQAAEQMQKAIAGVDPNDPAALRELAQTVSTFAPERALQIAAYAGELEKSKMGETVPVPAIVGYETEPDIDPLTGLQRTDENKQPLFKRNPIYRNVPFERTPQGLKSLVPGYSLPSGASTAVKDDAEGDAPKAQVSTDTVIDLGDDVSLVRPGQIAETRAGDQTQVLPQQVTSVLSPEAIERTEMQTGARGGGLGTFGTVAPPPKIQGETQYNPDVLQEEIDALQAQLNSLPRTSKARKQLQKEINKRRAKIRTSTTRKKKNSRGR